MQNTVNLYTPGQNAYYSAVSLWFIARIRKATDGSEWLLPDALVTNTPQDQAFILYTSRLDALVTCALFNRDDPSGDWQVYAFGDLDVKRLVRKHFAIAAGYAADEHYQPIKNGRAPTAGNTAGKPVAETIGYTVKITPNTVYAAPLFAVERHSSLVKRQPVTRVNAPSRQASARTVFLIFETGGKYPIRVQISRLSST